MPDDVAVVREPSLADALVPLGALAGLIAGSLARYRLDAVFCYASPALSVLYGFTGFRIEKTEPIALEEIA